MGKKQYRPKKIPKKTAIIDNQLEAIAQVDGSSDVTNNLDEVVDLDGSHQVAQASALKEGDLIKSRDISKSKCKCSKSKRYILYNVSCIVIHSLNK